MNAGCLSWPWSRIGVEPAEVIITRIFITELGVCRHLLGGERSMIDLQASSRSYSLLVDLSVVWSVKKRKSGRYHQGSVGYDQPLILKGVWENFGEFQRTLC